MTFRLRRFSEDGEELELTVAHAGIVTPRRFEIAWGDFDRASFDADELRGAAQEWRERARQEYASMALFTQLASQIHAIGAPLDWSGALVRMISDEVRHTELCARFAEILEPAVSIDVDESAIHLPTAAGPLRTHVRGVVVAAFCIGETLSGRVFRQCLRAASVPLARDIVRTIVDDETFHGRVGWELLALLMRGEDDRARMTERDALGAGLRDLFVHYRTLCGAAHPEAWSREPESAPCEAHNFGTLTPRGYARCFWDSMRDDIVPALVACGLPEATQAWAASSSANVTV